MIFEPIHTDAFRRWWPWVRDCLNKLIAKAGSDEWWPEDVFRELAEGRCILVVARTDEEEPVGFLVLQINRDTAGQYLYVWIIYAPGQATHASEWMDFLRATANRQSCYKIEGGSFRKGWEPLLKSLGFRPITTWELILPERTDEEAQAA